jgi:hypothetical protein
MLRLGVKNWPLKEFALRKEKKISSRQWREIVARFVGKVVAIGPG